ncbi:MAG: type II toxin-antitoxin system VapC family toxin [Gemmatimonadales bacterium]
MGTGVNITVDASAVIAVLLNEESKRQLVEGTRGTELLSPPTLYWEVGNALSALFKRRRIDLGQARAALKSLDDIAIRLADVDVVASVALAHEQSIYAYDAYVLECARRYRTPLLSLDGSQREVARKLGIEIVEVAG